MQNIEEQALATHTRTVPLWLRYVDDTFNAVHKDGIDDFHEHLNRQNEDIQFTKEIEENDKIPFLDCLVTRDNNNWTKNYYLQKTDTYRPITRPVFVQPDLCYLEALNRGTQRLFSVKCLPGEFCIAWGRLKISRWPFRSGTIFEAYQINPLRFSKL